MTSLAYDCAFPQPNTFAPFYLIVGPKVATLGRDILVAVVVFSTCVCRNSQPKLHPELSVFVTVIVSHDRLIKLLSGG